MKHYHFLKSYKKMKLSKITSGLFAIALITTIPLTAEAKEEIEIDYYQSIETVINPLNDKTEPEYVDIKTNNTNITLTNEEFQNLIRKNTDKIKIEKDQIIIEYPKQALQQTSQIALEEYYNRFKERKVAAILLELFTLETSIITPIVAIIHHKQKTKTKEK